MVQGAAAASARLADCAAAARQQSRALAAAVARARSDAAAAAAAARAREEAAASMEELRRLIEERSSELQGATERLETAHAELHLQESATARLQVRVYHVPVRGRGEGGGGRRACTQGDLEAAAAAAESLNTEAWEAAQRARTSALERDEAVATAGHLHGELERLRGELRVRAREVAGLRGDLRALQEQANVRVHACAPVTAACINFDGVCVCAVCMRVCAQVAAVSALQSGNARSGATLSELRAELTGLARELSARAGGAAAAEAARS